MDEGLSPITSTESPGFAIPAVQSGNFSAVAKLFRKRRSDSFLTGQADRNTGIDISISNPMVPNFTRDPAGMEMARQTTGMGQFVMDPMQHLEQKVDINHNPTLFAGNAPDLPTDSIRRKGISAYKKVNNK